MERITKIDEHGRAYVATEYAHGRTMTERSRAVDRLAAYEDTGLSPEDVIRFKKCNHQCHIDCILRHYEKFLQENHELKNCISAMRKRVRIQEDGSHAGNSEQKQED